MVQCIGFVTLLPDAVDFLERRIALRAFIDNHDLHHRHIHLLAAVMVPSANQAMPHDKQSLQASLLLRGTAFAPFQCRVRIRRQQLLWF